jgi:hypothetical protein
MIAKLRALRMLLVGLLVAGALTVALTPKPVGAYYGEIEGYRAINGSFGGQGCQFTITVFYGKRVQAYCQLRNASSGVVANKTNYHEYSCWLWNGCVYSDWIRGWDNPYGAWHPVGFMTMKKTDYGGLHAIINYAGPR